MSQEDIKTEYNTKYQNFITTLKHLTSRQLIDCQLCTIQTSFMSQSKKVCQPCDKNDIQGFIQEIYNSESNNDLDSLPKDVVPTFFKDEQHIGYTVEINSDSINSDSIDFDSINVVKSIHNEDDRTECATTAGTIGDNPYAAGVCQLCVKNNDTLTMNLRQYFTVYDEFTKVIVRFQ